MKKILILILSIVTTTALWADRFRVGDLCFNVTSSSRPYTVEVSAICYSLPESDNGSVSIIIPETITYDGITYSVTGISEFAFSNCSSLVSVTIPKSVTQIEQYAFNGCTQLSSITIPNGVTSIGAHAFDGCKLLSSITIPNSVTSIEVGAFANCSSLTSINIPSSVTSIRAGAFMGCSSLSSITVGRGNAVYDSRDNCNAIIVSASDVLLAGCKNTIIPNDIVGIATAAFSGCTSLESITIPESVTTIGDRAFDGCNALSKIIMESNNPPTIEYLGYLPGTMIQIPDNSLQAYQSAWDTKYKKYDFIHNGNTLTLHVETPGTLSKLLDEQGVDPMKVQSIILTGTINNSDWWDFYLYGFYKLKYMDLSGLSNTSDGFFPYSPTLSTPCPDLVQVILPKNLKRIESNAFKYFRKLRFITIPNSVESIGSSAFYGCTALISMIIPNSVTTIEAEAFAYCDYLTSISIPNSVITIQDEAFKHCASLNSITIPNSVTSIGAKAFHDCHKLDFVNIPESVTRIGIYAFDCSRFKHSLSISKDGALYIDNCLIKVKENQNGDFVIKPGTRLIADGAFEGCTSLTSVTIPNSVASIGDWTFWGCTSLTSVTIPNSVTSIGAGAFAGCTSLTSITIPNSVTSIGKSAFEGCSSLSSVTISNGVTSIESETFAHCDSLTSVTIPDSVKSIGDRAFSHCSLLASVTIPNNVMEIGEEAFVGTIIYNDSTNWENGALYIDNCLLKVKEEKIGYKYTIKPGTRLIADVALSGCNELRSIKIPNSVKIIGGRAFEYCSSLPSITLPDSVMSIGELAFRNCLDLKSIVIPKGVIEIAPYTFKNCTTLTTVTIPIGVTSIGEKAFTTCLSLKSIEIPNSVTSIGENAFKDCPSRMSIFVRAYTPPVLGFWGLGCYDATCNIPCGTLAAYEASDWAQYVDDFKENCDGNAITYTSSEDTIVSIRTVDAFDATIVSNTYEDGIGTIIFDAPLTNIRDSAFNGCASLSSITIPKTVTKIGVAVFEDCDALTSITVANGNTIYDSRDNCNAIITIADNELVAGCQSTVIPNGVTSIGTGAFRGCDSLIKITIPESVTSIEAYAFAKCESLDSIYVEATKPPILAGNVFENSPATICYVPCGTLKEYETSEWSKYVGKILEKDCQKCGDYLYWEVVDNQLIITGTGDMYHFDTIPQPWEKMRYQIQQISMPEGMTSIGASAFKECLFVTTVTIPSTVKEIHYRAFEDCRMLSNVSFAVPSSLTNIGHWAFYNCHKLSSITVPEGVTVMGEEVFYGCEVGKSK